MCCEDVTGGKQTGTSGVHVALEVYTCIVYVKLFKISIAYYEKERTD